MAEHLAGFASYGTYVIDPGSEYRSSIGAPLSPTNTVKYIVVDLDDFDPELYSGLVAGMGAMEDALYECAKYGPHNDMSRALLMERSGGKGFHAWLFLAEPVPAWQARQFAAEHFMPTWAEMTGGLAVEVFPKQDEVAPGGFGNLVKLPLGVHAVTGNRSELICPPGWANAVDSVVGAPVGLIKSMERVKPHRSASAGSPAGATPFPCIDRIIEEGVGSGNRDNAMYHFALYCVGHGLPQDLTLQWCNEVNVGFEPPLSDGEVRTKVNSAYAGGKGSSCGSGWLSDFCPGPCKASWSVGALSARPAPRSDASKRGYLHLSPDERRKVRNA